MEVLPIPPATGYESSAHYGVPDKGQSFTLHTAECNVKKLSIALAKTLVFLLPVDLGRTGDTQLVFLNLDSEGTTSDRSTHDLPYQVTDVTSRHLA